MEKIKETFKHIITKTQGIEDPKVDWILDRWYHAKRDFIEAFGGLIYTYPQKVTFTLSEEDKATRVEKFWFKLEDEYGADIVDFVYRMRDSFYSNLTNEDYVTQSGKVIKKGSKIIKSFKYFISDPSDLEKVQNQASQIIQENKVEGWLRLSVHPIDFLTASENNNNWRSCHALDGDYRAGNLSYMIDKSTIICYLDSGNDEYLERLDTTWNSKKWRMWLHFSDDGNMLFAGRQYPFFSKNAINIIKNECLPQIYKGTKYTEWDDFSIKTIKLPDKEMYFRTEYIPVGGYLKDIRELVVNNSKLHFNDVLDSSYYKPYYAYRVFSEFFPSWGCSNKDTTNFYIGAKVSCLACGKEWLINSESMRCYNCER